MKMYNGGVKDLAKKLEKYRLDHDLTKTQMGSFFGVSYQTYYSWIKRNSVPKGHLETARTILSLDGDASKLNAELLELFSRLPDDKRRILLELAEGFLGQHKPA